MDESELEGQVITMSKELAQALRQNAKELAHQLAWAEALLFKSLGEPWLTPHRSSWIDLMFKRFRADGKMRVEVYREALASIAGYMESEKEADVLNCLSDWLRNGCYLYASLREEHLPRVRELVIGVLKKFVESGFAEKREAHAAQGSLKEFLSNTVGHLFAQLPQAVECFKYLRQLNDSIPANNESAAGMENYWNASARLSPMFTIDWACFNRADLFDNNGLHAANWLVKKGFASPSSSILEIGCGMGRVERHLARKVAHVYGVDISEQMISLASEWLSDFDNVTLLKTDGQCVPLPDDSADTVFAFMVFLDVKNPALWKNLFMEVSRVLKPGGCFLFTLDSDTFARTFQGVERLRGHAHFEKVSIGRVDSRSINSFRFEWDFLYVFRKAALASSTGLLAARS